MALFTYLFLHLGNDVVNGLCLSSELPGNRESSCDIRSIAMPFTSRIKAHKLSSFERLVVGNVMKGAGILSSARNDTVSLVLGLCCYGCCREDCFGLSFIFEILDTAEDIDMRPCRDIIGRSN